MSSAKKTTDHKVIRTWIEKRGGRPATVVRTEGEDGEPGILRVDFPADGMDEGLEAVEWDDFFRKFDEESLAFLHQDKTEDGELSRFCKFVSR